MNRFVDVSCPSPGAAPRGRTLTVLDLSGTRWLHNPNTRKWYMVKVCPHCRGVHPPAGVHTDRLVVPPRSL